MPGTSEEPSTDGGRLPRSRRDTGRMCGTGSFEETGLKVKNITYFSNQPWPYPSGLMVGFIADYESGEIKLQEDELTAAAFYSKDNLPEIPRKLSIARRLIDWWMENN